MATPLNTNNTRVGSSAGTNNSTSKKTYTTLKYGNDHGSLSFGHIHKQGDVRSDVMLQASEGTHQICMDKDGPRKGWTTSTSPGHFQIQCGRDSSEDEDTLYLNALNGNIVLKANNGKVRIEGDDVEIVAKGSNSSQGNIALYASESFYVNARKVLLNGRTSYKIVTSGKAILAANSSLKIYSSIIRGVTDGVSLKDSKIGGKDFQEQNLK